MCRRPVHKPLGHSVTTGAFDKHLSPQDKRQHERIGGDRLCSCAQTVEMTTAVEKYQIIWGRIVRANISFHINGCHGDTYKDLEMVKWVMVLKRGCWSKRNCDPLFVLKFTHFMGSCKTAHFISLSLACLGKTQGRACHLKLEGSLPMWFWVKVWPHGSEPDSKPH